MPKATTCHSCGAKVYWSHDAEGHAIMLDPPGGDGYMWAVVRDDDSVRIVDAADEGAIPVRSHLPTCPGPDRWGG